MDSSTGGHTTDRKRSHDQFQFLQNKQAVDSGTAGIEIEIAVTAESDIRGECQWGPYKLIMWDIGDIRQGEERDLCLIMTDAYLLNDERQKEALDSATKNGYYSGVDIGSELVILASLFLRRRLRTGPIVRFRGRPCRLIRHTVLDSNLVSGTKNLSELQEWFDLAARLNVEYQNRFMLAARLYATSLELIDRYPDIAYINLVSAIETLADTTNITPCLQVLGDQSLEKAIDSIQDPHTRAAVTEAVLSREKLLKQHFVRFILDHVEPSFWDVPDRPKYGRVLPSELEGFLRKIYDCRSAALHDGLPFPPSVYVGPYDGSEKPLGLGEMTQGRKWRQQDLVPLPHFFERLVNHVLKSFLRRNQST